MTCAKPHDFSACPRPCCAKRRASGLSRRPNPAKAGCSLSVTLSLSWTGFTLSPGKRR